MYDNSNFYEEQKRDTYSINVKMGKPGCRPKCTTQETAVGFIKVNFTCGLHRRLVSEGKQTHKAEAESNMLR